MGRVPLERKLTWFLAFLPLFFPSCEKDELTKPVEVHFQFRLDRLPPQAGNVSFQAGTLDIESIAFFGDRDTGEDISFVSDFGAVVRADLATGTSSPLVKFDIPRGTYSQIRLLVDPDDTEPDIVVTGRFMRLPAGMPVPMQLEIDLQGQLDLIVRAPDGGSEIPLHKDRPVIEVFLNPSGWFAEIPLSALEAADLQDIRGVPSIVISKNFNQDMYLKLADLLETSAEAIFMEP